ncbi:RIIAD1, partial [Symbiodinium natans]
MLTKQQQALAFAQNPLPASVGRNPEGVLWVLVCGMLWAISSGCFAISAPQFRKGCALDELDITKIKVNMDNEKYLLAHPEIRDMLSVFVHQVLEYKPDNILRFAGDFFTRDDLYACVKKKTEE